MGRIYQIEITEKISYPILTNKLHLELSASIGIAIFPDDGSSVETLLSFADKQMYNEKRKA